MKARIAIDGPAGAGKSTIARKLATKLGYIHLDSGALYRAVTVAVFNKNGSFEDSKSMRTIAETCDLDVRFEPDGQHVYLDGTDVSQRIRENVISQHVSYVAKDEFVRQVVSEKLKTICKKGGVVVDGRDIGTVVIPDAEVKIFLTASPRVRAERRRNELLEKGQDIPVETLEAEIKKRDEIDSTREFAPLLRADDAVDVDTSGMGIEEVLNCLEEIVKEKESR